MSESRTKREARAREVRAAVRQYALWQLPYIRETKPDPDGEALSWLYVARARLEALIWIEEQRLESKSGNAPQPGGLESG